MIKLLQNWYIDKNEIRQKELELSFFENYNNPIIDKLIFFVEEGINLPKIDEKIEIVKCTGRPTYQAFFNYCQDPETIYILMNTDCSLHSEVSKTLIEKIDDDQFWCITKREETKEVFSKLQPDCQDCWIWKGKCRINNGNFLLGFLGCDNAIAYCAKETGYILKNYMYDICVIHHHKSGIRNYSKNDRLSLPYAFVYPEKMIATKISCLCITYGRVHFLEEALECFLKQDYPYKELIIVNDLAEQELIFNHPKVKIFNFKERFKTIGEKRNKSVELSSGEILVSWDDDDINLPWRLTQIAKVFNANPNLGYFKPEKSWCQHGPKLLLPEGGPFFTTVAFSRKAYNAIGGYKSTNVGEDTDLCYRLVNYLKDNAKTIPFSNEEYAFIYVWNQKDFWYHLSAFGPELDGIPNTNKIEKIIKSKPIEPVVHLKPHWNQDYLSITRNALLIPVPVKDFKGPPGYTFCAYEGESYTLNTTGDIAYGYGDKFNYLYNYKGKIAFNNETFKDPIPNQRKMGFYKITKI